MRSLDEMMLSRVIAKVPLEPAPYPNRQGELYKCIQTILDGRECGMVGEPFISMERLLACQDDVPLPAKSSKKILVITLNQLISVAIYNMFGPHCVKSPLVFKTKASSAILTITSTENTAGLDMPFITHIVFYHNSSNAVMQQAVGRAHRMGRTHNLTVYRILY